jgi:regulator of replication initiation timing
MSDKLHSRRKRAKNTEESKDPTASCFAAIGNEFVANIHGSGFHVCFKNALPHVINFFFENKSDI